MNFIPSRKKEDENAALATPLSLSGTPEELDRELGSNLASYVEENLRLQSTLAEAKAEMEAAAKTARDQARAMSITVRSPSRGISSTNTVPPNLLNSPGRQQNDLGIFAVGASGSCVLGFELSRGGKRRGKQLV